MAPDSLVYSCCFFAWAFRFHCRFCVCSDHCYCWKCCSVLYLVGKVLSIFSCVLLPQQIQSLYLRSCKFKRSAVLIGFCCESLLVFGCITDWVVFPPLNWSRSISRLFVTLVVSSKQSRSNAGFRTCHGVIISSDRTPFIVSLISSSDCLPSIFRVFGCIPWYFLRMIAF